jgi:hypothetical protein
VAPGPGVVAKETIEQYSGGEGLPCADEALLTPLRRSWEYRATRKRMASETPLDTWQEDGAHFFVFELEPDDDLEFTPLEPAVAVFVMTTGSDELVSAVSVTPSPDGSEARIDDLRRSESGWLGMLGRAKDAAVSPMLGPFQKLRSR